MGDSLAAGDDVADLIEHAVHWTELALASRAFPVPEVCEGVERLLVLLRVPALNISRAHICKNPCALSPTAALTRRTSSSSIILR